MITEKKRSKQSGRTISRMTKQRHEIRPAYPRRDFILDKKFLLRRKLLITGVEANEEMEN